MNDFYDSQVDDLFDPEPYRLRTDHLGRVLIEDEEGITYTVRAEELSGTFH